MNTRVLSMILLMATLAACSRPAEEPAPSAPASDAAPAADAPSADAPATDSPAPSEAPTQQTPADPAQPAPDAPPPTDPSPTAKPTSAATEPDLGSMRSARPAAKIGVPVDLKYSFDSQPLTNQPVTLHLAAVPRVSGSNLHVSFKEVAGVQVVSAGALGAQKANATGAYRQHYSVTRQDSGPAELRVLVTMETPEGSAFGFFGIPFDTALAAGNPSQKRNSVKQP